MSYSGKQNLLYNKNCLPAIIDESDIQKRSTKSYLDMGILLSQFISIIINALQIFLKKSLSYQQNNFFLHKNSKTASLFYHHMNVTKYVCFVLNFRELKQNHACLIVLFFFMSINLFLNLLKQNRNC